MGIWFLIGIGMLTVIGVLYVLDVKTQGRSTRVGILAFVSVLALAIVWVGSSISRIADETQEFNRNAESFVQVACQTRDVIDAKGGELVGTVSERGGEIAGTVDSLEGTVRDVFPPTTTTTSEAPAEEDRGDEHHEEQPPSDNDQPAPETTDTTAPNVQFECPVAHP